MCLEFAMHVNGACLATQCIILIFVGLYDQNSVEQSQRYYWRHNIMGVIVQADILLPEG